MRTITAIAGLALTAIAIGGFVGTTRRPPEPTPTTIAATATPTTTPTPTPTGTEPAYTRAELRFASDSDPYTTIEEGWEICGKGDDFGSEPPSLDAIIENRDFGGDDWKAAITHLCPKYLPLLRKARGGFTDGTYTVGEDIRPGTYRTTPGRVTDCYWERSTGGGQIIANDFVTNAPKGVTVTLRAGEGFTSRECGNWIRA